MRFHMLLIVVASAVLGLSERPISAAPPNDLSKRVERLIVTLGNDDYSKREQASAELAQLPPEAVPALEAALARTNISGEVRARLQQAVVPLRCKYVRMARYKRALAFNLKTTVEAYDRVGQRDPKWNDLVRRAFTLASQVWSNEEMIDELRAKKAHLLCAQALRLGCNDPMLLYVDERMTSNFLKQPPPAATTARTAMAMGASAYPAIRKAWTYSNAAGARLNELRSHPVPFDKQVTELLDNALRMLPEAAKDRSVTKRNLLEGLTKLILQFQGNGDTRLAAFEKIDKQLALALPAESYVRLCFKGDFLIKYAWDARGAGWAANVTPEGWAGFRSRLADAQRALEKAWAIDPSEPYAPTLMITVELGQGQGRPRMEQWFARAMATNPDNMEAVNAKYHYLEPNWYGSKQEQRKFVEECATIEGGGTAIAFKLLAVDLQDALPAQPMVLDKIHPVFNAPYYARAQFWNDIQLLYEPFLKRHPDATGYRSIYAYYAWQTRHWDVADRQFAILGDEVKASEFGGKMLCDALRKDIHDRLAAGNAPTSIDGPVQARRDARLKFYQSILSKAYAQFGHHDPKWDHPAQQALELMARYNAAVADVPADVEEQILALTQEAMDSGCDDPVVRFVNAYIFDRAFQCAGPKATARSYGTLDTLLHSRYPVSFKYFALIWACNAKATLEQPLQKTSKAAVAHTLEQAAALLGQVAADPLCTRGDLADKVTMAIKTAQVIGLDHIALAQQYMDLMLKGSKAGADDRAVLLVQGRVAYLRTDGVTGGRLTAGLNMQERRKAINACLDEGEKALLRCWQEDPNDPLAPMAMFPICYKRSLIQPCPEADIWLRRALDADPNGYEVCDAWRQQHIMGSASQIYDFLGACVNTNNYASGIPLLYCYWYMEMARFANGGINADPSPAWIDSNRWYWIAAVYTEYLQRYPNAYEVRSNFAKAACATKHWDVAREQFNLLGDKVRIKVFGSKETMEAMRAAAAKQRP